MAAEVILRAGHSVTLYEKYLGPGRKLLIAGSSGLNISNASPGRAFWLNYRGFEQHFRILFENFSPESWLNFVHHLGIETFLGTSQRYFVDGMKAPPLLNAWISRLRQQNAQFKYGQELIDFSTEPQRPVLLKFRTQEGLVEAAHFEAVCLALGGASYAGNETPLRWPAIFRNKNLRFQEFRASNVGWEIEWPEAFLKEAEGLPLKRIVLETPLGKKSGDLMITHYGLEGTPVYHLGQPGSAFLDLKPDLSEEVILKKLRNIKENLAPLRKIKRQLSLCPAALALLFHGTPKEILNDLDLTVSRVKKFPIELKGPRPLEEAISSAGGLAFEELTSQLMLLRFPGIFVAGEMLDWDAPTGGFLIQGCASQGHFAGCGIVDYLR